MANSTEDPKINPSAETILGLLNEDTTRKVFLLGRSGVGKTWMAREVCHSARLKYLSYGTLWFTPEDNLSRQSGPEDYERRVAENVALQLSVYSSHEEYEDDSEVLEPEDLDKDSLKQRIQDKLGAMKLLTSRQSTKPDKSNSATTEPTGSQGMERIYLLIVLDGLALDDENEILEELDKLLPFSKYLIMGADDNQNVVPTRQVIQESNHGSRVCLMKGLSVQNSLQLLEERVKGYVRASLGFEKLCTAIKQVDSDLPAESGSHQHGSRSDFLPPSVIVMLAEALNNVERLTLGVGNEQHAGEWTLDSALDEAAAIFRSGDITKMVSLVHEMLPSNETINYCAWHCRHLFTGPCAMHCNELIAHWLLEGYFDDLENIEMAFKKGYRMLTGLKDRAILKERENSFVFLEVPEVVLHDHRRFAFHATARLGLADVMTENGSWTGLGRITLANGIMKTSYPRKDQISTLFIDGVSHLCRQFPGAFLDSMRNLRVLVILNPTFKELPLPLLDLKDIQVLVLRHCSTLVNVDKLIELEKLSAVEISGASLLETIADDLFGKMQNLRSINLSGAGIRSVPYSLMGLGELRWLILRDCKKLEVLPSLRSLVKLEVLDLSGCTNFRKLSDKSFSTLQNLHTVDLSRTNMDRLPIFRGLAKLHRLLLSQCPELARLSTLQPLEGLEILDLSGAMTFKGVQEASLAEKPGLDLPQSAIIRIPKTICNLTHLLLKDCTKLEVLSSIVHLKDLRVLDLSGASSLRDIRDGSFEDLRELRDLILSGTKIVALPKLCEGSKIRRLLLKDCLCLTMLPNLEELKSLEILDLSGCSGLEITAVSFKHMSNLRILNLSGTKLLSLPSDCFPSGLSQLILRDCALLRELPAMESLKGLEKLDLCGSRNLRNVTVETLKCLSNLLVLNLTDVPLNGLPPMSQLTKLRELSLGGCSSEVQKLEDLTGLELLDLSRTKRVSLPPLKSFPKLRQLLLRNCCELKELVDLKVLKNLEVLDIAGTKIAFPLDIINMTGLKKLHLQEMRQSDWRQIKHVPEDFSLQICGQANPSPDHRTSLVISGMTFFHILKDNANLWNSCFKKFHFSVWIPKEETKQRSKEAKRNAGLLEGNTGFLKDVNSIGRIPFSDEYGRCLEIHGSFVAADERSFASYSAAPTDSIYEVPSDASCEPINGYGKVLKDALMHAEHVSLIDNMSIRSISQLGLENLKAMESLWLESCPNITYIINEREDVGVGEKLRSLYLWNLPSLCSSYADAPPSEFFTDLKTLHVECCPLLENFYFHRLPENLGVARVKFCQAMTVIFDSYDESAECKLQKLHLVELPNLIKIGVLMPLLKELRLRGCPGVVDLEEVLGKAENLETLHISDAANLNGICTGPQESTSFQNLIDLKIESCPTLTEMFSCPVIPKKLKFLEIKHCRELKSLFNSNSPPVSLSSLCSLQLWNLPNLKSIGIKIPSGCSVGRWDCPNLPETIERS